MENKIGIWLDQKEAIIIRFKDGNSTIQQIDSDMEDFHVVGGARSKTPWGPMDVVSEKKALERNKHQLKAYFDKVVQTLHNGDLLYLFGPAETKFKFKDMISEEKGLGLQVLQADTADSMTERQMVAQARKAFGMKPSKF